MKAQPHEQTAVIREGAAAAQPEAQAGHGGGWVATYHMLSVRRSPLVTFWTWWTFSRPEEKTDKRPAPEQATEWVVGKEGLRVGSGCWVHVRCDRLIPRRGSMVWLESAS